MVYNNMIKSYRHELKYICTDQQICLIKHRLLSLLQYDLHAGSNGEYIISSLYFDDCYNTCYHENANGEDPRCKFRIRIYNHSEEHISLEKKIKINGMTRKEICLIDGDIFEKMIAGDDCRAYLGRNNLLDQWILDRKVRMLRPRCIIEYKRIPLIYKLGNVRITFDSQICANNDISTFFKHDTSGINVLPMGIQVLEVKYDSFLPDIIYDLCNIGHLYQCTFSKFFLCCNAMEGNEYVI